MTFAEFVGRDKRLLNPLIKAFKKSRGWKRWLVLEIIRYLKYDKKTFLRKVNPVRELLISSVAFSNGVNL